MRLAADVTVPNSPGYAGAYSAASFSPAVRLIRAADRARRLQPGRGRLLLSHPLLSFREAIPRAAKRVG
jgi:hypothetical protein